MSFAGFKKQINKANQYVSEKMGTAEGTKMDDDFIEMEKKTEAITTLVDHLIPKTKEFLHPNPAVRAKMYINRDKGLRPQETQEGELGDMMLKASRELSVDSFESEYASSLKDVGCALIEVSDSRNDMIFHLEENFLVPLIDLENKDLKDLAANMKKLQGRRLDFDCKKRKAEDLKRKGNRNALQQARQETRLAEAKFDESTGLTKAGMAELLNNEVEMIHQLSQLVCGLLEFHKKSADTLERSVMLLNKRVAKAKSGSSSGNLNPSAKGMNPLADNSVSVSKPKPCCRAKADYQKKNDDELSFKAGDLIMLSGRPSDDWYEGVLEGKIGKIPVPLVRIIADLPEKNEEEEEEEEVEKEEEEEEAEEEETEVKEEEKKEEKEETKQEGKKDGKEEGKEEVKQEVKNEKQKKTEAKK